jgi:outer membrane protein TolC
MKILIAIVVLLPFQVRSQTEPDERQEAPDPVSGAAGAPDVSVNPSPGLDSLYRRLASLEVEKARSLATSSNFWHRLIPQVSLGGAFGVRDLAFPDAAGTIFLPKDSYRVTVGLSLSALLDGAEHTRAELHLAETETRFSILIHRQSLARLALEGKKNELSADLSALREELSVREPAVAYQELLFVQGRADFHAVAGARIDLVRLKHAVARLEIRVRELEKTLGGGSQE